MNEQLITLAAQVLTALVLAGLGVLVRKWSQRADFETRLNLLRLGAGLAYGVVNEISRKTANTTDDKIALGLKEMNDFLAKQGQPAMSPNESEVAKTMFTAQHGMEKVAAARPQ